MTTAAALRQALAAGRLAHAYLICGADAAGRLELAEAAAAALNCAAPQDGQPCRQCRSCRQTASRSHPDVHILAPEGKSVRVAQARQLEAALSRAPYQGGAKAVIVTAADQLTPEAANALLKTLEEPPPRTYFFLLADQAAALLPTVRSRCQAIHLAAAGAAGSGMAYWQRLCAAAPAELTGAILAELEGEADLDAVLGGMARACRDSLVWRWSGAERLLLTPQQREIDSRGFPHLARCCQSLAAARRFLRHNANKRLVLETLLLDLREEKERGNCR